MQSIDKVLLQVKHWQLFIIFASVWLFETMLHIRISPLVVLIYVIILGVRLKKLLPGYFKNAYVVFLLAGIVAVLSMGFMLGILSTTGDDVIPILSVIMTISFIVVVAFVGRAIRTIETRDRTTLKDYFIDIVWVATFMPFGLWMIQPRLNDFDDQFYR